MTGEEHFVIKVAAGGAPWNHSGLMQLYSQRTGQLEALLLDQGVLTELRTAAAGAVATRLLGPKVVTKIGMLGTGVQSRYQLRYLQSVTDCRRVMVYGRTPENVNVLKADLEKLGWIVEIAMTPNDLMQQCSLVITTCEGRSHYDASNPTNSDYMHWSGFAREARVRDGIGGKF
jgi:ornithine cyclodeaminase